MALTLFALVTRLWTCDFALPHCKDSDSHLVATQLSTFRDTPLFLREGNLDWDALHASGIYPHLLGRVAHLVSPDAPRSIDGPTAFAYDHQLAAGSDERLMRQVVAILSVGIVPGTFALARSFVPAWWALLAAALSAFSLLDVGFSVTARPHAVAASFVTLALAACLKLRQRGTTAAFLAAGAWTALAIGTLQNAVPVLFAGLAAVLLRERPTRRFTDPRLLLPVALVCLSLLCFWPFLWTVPWKPAQAPGSEVPASLQLANQQLWFSDFHGRGARVVFLTLRSFEPLTALFALLAAGVWILRAARKQLDSQRAKDCAVLCCYAVPYLAFLCAFDKSMQRFVLPLVPLLACMAAWVLHAFSKGKELQRRLAIAAAVLVAAFPAYVSSRWIYLRCQPDTLTTAAFWFRTHAYSSNPRIGLHFALDLPLPRTPEGLFEADGSARHDVYSPWGAYQQMCGPVAESSFVRHWQIFTLFGPQRTPVAEILSDPAAYIRSWNLDYIVLPSPAESSVGPALSPMRDYLVSHADLVASIPESDHQESLLGSWGMDSPQFVKYVMAASAIGPRLEIFRIRTVP